SVSASARPFLDRHGLTPFFDVIVTGDEIERGKPDPDIYLLAAEKLGIRADACLVIEDALSGIAAGKAAGMRVAAIPDRRVVDARDYEQGADYELEVYEGPEAPPKKLIIEKVKSGIDGLITTLRDPIDAEVFEAGKGTLKVVAQIAVGFDNINRADANKYKIPFTNTADVLTEATAEFAFFMMGVLARKMWQSERLVREQKWPSWHPFLPFLGDEVTGKTIAVIGTGRIGLAIIKKCTGFDMNIPCYDPIYQNDQFIAS